MTTSVVGSNELTKDQIGSPAEISDLQRILLRAERLQPTLRRVQAQQAVITRRSVAVRKTIEIDVFHEELVVEYLDGDGSVVLEGDFDPIIIVLHEEQVEVIKHVRPVQEVRISKRSVVEEQRITDTVRHETLEIAEHML